MRFYPLLIFVALLFNLGSVVLFKFKVTRDFNNQISELRKFSDERFERFGSDVLFRIDSYLASNVVSRTSSGASLIPTDNQPSVFYEIVGRDFDYEFFFDGKPHANIDGSYLSIGDLFPRGGVISDITRDGILVSGRYLFLRPSRLAKSSLSSSQSLSFNQTENGVKP